VFPVGEKRVVFVLVSLEEIRIRGRGEIRYTGYTHPAVHDIVYGTPGTRILKYNNVVYITLGTHIMQYMI